MILIVLFSLFETMNYSLLFGGSAPHYFYQIMERTLTGRSKLNQLLFFACERLIYTPAFQVLSLFFLSIFEVSAIALNPFETYLHLGFELNFKY